MTKPTTQIFVCGAVLTHGSEPCQCDSKAALELLHYLRQRVEEREMHGVMVTACECMGHCEYSPVVIVHPQNTWYCQVDQQGAEEILDAVWNAALIKSVSGCAGCHR